MLVEFIADNFTPFFLVSLCTSVVAVLAAACASRKFPQAWNTTENGEQETDPDAGPSSTILTGPPASAAAVPSVAAVAEKVIAAGMTEEQKQEEKEFQRKQLEEIFRVMKQHQDKFGDTSLNDLMDQMRMYR